MPWLDLRRLCGHIQRYHRLWSGWTIPKGSRQYQDSHRWNSGCATRTLPYLNNAYEDGLFHPHRNSSDFSHTYDDGLDDDDTYSFQDTDSSLKPDCLKSFIRSHRDKDTHAYFRIGTNKYAICLLPHFHASSKRHIYTANLCSANLSSTNARAYEDQDANAQTDKNSDSSPTQHADESTAIHIHASSD